MELAWWHWAVGGIGAHLFIADQAQFRHLEGEVVHHVEQVIGKIPRGLIDLVYQHHAALA